jgi:hypothetical protein
VTAMCRHLSVLALVVGITTLTACPPKEDKVEVKVLAILASEHHTTVHKKLTEFAKHVQKKDPKLTGFKLHNSAVEGLTLGETKQLPLVGDEVVKVTVNKELNENGRITLTIKPPKLDPITYECTCDKYLAVATQHFVGKDKDRQQLFIAVMAKPCVPQKAGKK